MATWFPSEKKEITDQEESPQNYSHNHGEEQLNPAGVRMIGKTGHQDVNVERKLVVVSVFRAAHLKKKIT